MDIVTLTSHPLFNLLNALVGIIGVGLAIYFYFRAKERYALSYKVNERQLIQASSLRPYDMDVPLSWSGREVARLTRSFILISNSGNKLIEKSDITKIATIQVSKGSEIIDATLIFSDDPGNQVFIKGGSTNSREIDFEFIRPKDGYIIKIDHTGSLNEIFVECSTKAGGTIRKINEGPRAALTLAVMTPVMLLAGYLIFNNLYLPLPEPFDRATIIKYGGWAQLYVSFIVGFAAALATLLAYVILVLAVRLATKRTLLAPRSAANIFISIGLNTKGASE